MIGDLSVQGSILEPDAVGEMVLLAREAGARVLLVPSASREDLEGLPVGLVEGLEIVHRASPTDYVVSGLKPGDG